MLTQSIDWDKNQKIQSNHHSFKLVYLWVLVHHGHLTHGKWKLKISFPTSHGTQPSIAN